MSNFGERIIGYFGGSGGGGGTPVPPNPTNGFMPYNDNGAFADSYWFVDDTLINGFYYTDIIGFYQTEVTPNNPTTKMGDWSSTYSGTYFEVNSSANPYIKTFISTIETFGIVQSIGSFGDVFLGNFSGSNAALVVRNQDNGQVSSIYTKLGGGDFGINITYDFLTTDFSATFGDISSNNTKFIVSRNIGVSSFRSYIGTTNFVTGLLSEANEAILGFYEPTGNQNNYLRISNNNVVTTEFGNFPSVENLGLYFDFTNLIYKYGDISRVETYIQISTADSTDISLKSYALSEAYGIGVTNNTPSTLASAIIGNYDGGDYCFGILADLVSEFTLLAGSAYFDPDFEPSSGIVGYLEVSFPTAGLRYIPLYQ